MIHGIRKLQETEEITKTFHLLSGGKNYCLLEHLPCVRQGMWFSDPGHPVLQSGLLGSAEQGTGLGADSSALSRSCWVCGPGHPRGWQAGGKTLLVEGARQAQPKLLNDKAATHPSGLMCIHLNGPGQSGQGPAPREQRPRPQLPLAGGVKCFP